MVIGRKGNREAGGGTGWSSSLGGVPDERLAIAQCFSANSLYAAPRRHRSAFRSNPIAKLMSGNIGSLIA